MGCTPAPACRSLLAEATILAPGRNKASDGICASPKHTAANPTSDHETGDAVDLTHDPAAGCDVDALFAGIVKRRDPRVKYLIWRRRILRSYDKPGVPAWTWTPYTGSNPHEKHGHVSIVPGARNNTALWFITPQEDDMTPEQAKELTYAKDQAEKARWQSEQNGNAIAALSAKVDAIGPGAALSDSDVKRIVDAVVAEIAS